MALDGQTEIPQPEGPSIVLCAWCDKTAEVDIQVQPAHIIKRKNPQTGEPVAFVKKAAVVVPACEDHRKVERTEPEKKARKKVSEEQTEMFPKDKKGPIRGQYL
jgi:hypothetical protein